LDRAIKAHPESERTLSRAPAVPLVACGIGLLLVVRYVASSGTWLDEYWQLWISGAPSGQLMVRLAADAHPPWFNLFARPIVAMTGGAIVPARILNLFGATAVLGVGLWRLRGLDPALRWRIALLLLASGGAVGMTGLAASFRSYPWLLVLAGLQAALLTAILLRRPIRAPEAAIITATSISLHYVHAAGAIAIAAVCVIAAWRTDRKASYAIAAGLIVGIALDIATGFMQLPHWRANFDVNWIGQAGGGGAFASLSSVGVDFLAGSFVASALLAVGLIARRSKTALLVLAPIPLAMIGWLILDARAPLLVPRYLASITALLATAAAVGWWELALGPVVNAAVAFLAALQPLATSVIRPPLPGWEPGARIAQSITRSCAQSQLYAISAWRFRDQPDSKTARFENSVVGFAYQQVGARFGLEPHFVTGPTTVKFDGCPAIVWIESAHRIEHVPVDVILRRAQLAFPTAARVRIVPTPNGGVLLISSADRLQPAP
jgi:hypothetical protein